MAHDGTYCRGATDCGRRKDQGSGAIIKLPSKKYLYPLIAVFFSVWALVLRFKRLAGRELWTDEIFQLKQTLGPFKPIWKINSYGDFSAFPGDYLLTYPFAQIFAYNKWGMAIPHILATIVGFFLLYKICRRYFQTPLGYVVAFAVVCFNQYLIFHSFEFRPYGVLSTLALAGCYFADILVDKNVQLSLGKKLAIGAFFIFTIWFHAFGIMCVVLPLLYFTLAKRKDPSFKIILKDIFRFSCAVFAIALPLWLWYASGDPLHNRGVIFKQMGIKTFQYIPNPLDNFGRFFNYVFFYYLIGYKRLYFFLGGLILLIVVPFKDKLKKLGFFFTLIVLPITSIFVATLSEGYWFLLRQFIYLSPLLAFFLGWLWDSSLGFYLDKGNRPFSLRAKVGLFLMVGCLLAGSIGLILYA